MLHLCFKVVMIIYDLFPIDCLIASSKANKLSLAKSKKKIE